MTTRNLTAFTGNPTIDQPLYDPEWLGEISSPTVRAALTLAGILHMGQWRTKRDVSLSYISHPVAAMNILRADGINQPIVLAAALLHDTLEDCGAALLKAAMELNHYDPILHATVNHPIARYDELKAPEIEAYVADMPFQVKVNALSELLSQNIHEEYISSGYDEKTASHMAANSTVEIIDIIKELTNKSPAEAQFDNKRFFQTDKARTYSKEAREVKMAEMAASMADDIMHAPDRTTENLVRFYNRCWMVSKVCAEARPSLFRLVQNLYQDATAAAHHSSLREEPEVFSLKARMEAARMLPDVQHLQQAAFWVDNDGLDEKGQPRFRTAEKGLLSVGLTSDGKVAAFRMLTNRADVNNFGQPDAVNDAALRFVDHLETGRSFVALSRMKEFHNVRHARKMVLTLAIPLEAFIEAALQEQVMQPEFAEQLRTAAKNPPTTQVNAADCEITSPPAHQRIQA